MNQMDGERERKRGGKSRRDEIVPMQTHLQQWMNKKEILLFEENLSFCSQKKEKKRNTKSTHDDVAVQLCETW